MDNKIPIYIIEEHNEAFAIWYYGYHQGLFTHSASLLHVDHHEDMECGGYPFNFTNIISNQSQATCFSRQVTGIADFIVPALYMGFFQSMFMIRSTIPIDFRSEERYVHLKESNVLTTGKYIPFLHGKYKNEPESGSKYRFFQYYEGSLSPCDIKPGCVLDIDLDYFSWDDSLSTSDEKLLEITREAYLEYKNNEHHPFRILPRQLLSIKCINNRYYLHYKEYFKPTTPASKELIEKRINNLIKWLTDNKIRPAIIDICRSRLSGYTPRPIWNYIEETLLNKLKQIYPITVRRKSIEALERSSTD